MLRVLLSSICLIILRWSFLVSDLSCWCLSSSMSSFSLFISAEKVGDFGRGRLLRNSCRCFLSEMALWPCEGLMLWYMSDRAN